MHLNASQKKLFLFGRESDQICLKKENFPPLILENEITMELKKLFKDNFDITCEIEITDNIPKHKGKNQRVFYKK